MKLIFSFFFRSNRTSQTTELRPHEILNFWLDFYLASIFLGLGKGVRKWCFQCDTKSHWHLPYRWNFRVCKYSFRRSLLDRHRPENVAMKKPMIQCPLMPFLCRSNEALMNHFVRRNKWPAQDIRTTQYHIHWPRVPFVTIVDQIVFQSLWLPHLCIHLLKDLKFNDKQIKGKWNFIIFYAHALSIFNLKMWFAY